MEAMLRKFLEGARARSNRRYPQELRMLGAEYAEARVAAGESVGPIAARLGIAEPTLRSWLRKARPGFVPVVVEQAEAAKDQAGQTVVLVSPNGYRLEGLELAAACELLRVLG